MRTLIGQDVIGYAKQLYNHDIKIQLLFDLADERAFQGLHELDTAAGDAPVVGLGRLVAQHQEHSIGIVNDQCPNAYLRICHSHRPPSLRSGFAPATW